MNNILEQAITIRDHLDSNKRIFVAEDPYAVDTFETKFKRVDNDTRLLRYANDQIGCISDCFILLAIMTLGVCDIISIQNYLHSMHIKNPNYSLPNYQDLDMLRRRLDGLESNGFIINYRYRRKKTDGSERHLLLYACGRDAIDFVSKRLDRPYKNNSWLQAMRPQELISWAAAAKVGSQIAQYPSFSEYGMGKLFMNNETHFFPCELKMSADNTWYHVAVCNTFLNHDIRVMSQNEFKDFIINKLNFILMYITYRSRIAEARVVCVVESNANLVLLAKWIKKAERFNDVLQKIYFTGEGAILESNGDVAGSFLQMTYSEQFKEGFTFYQSTPDFLG